MERPWIKNMYFLTSRNTSQSYPVTPFCYCTLKTHSFKDIPKVWVNRYDSFTTSIMREASAGEKTELFCSSIIYLVHEKCVACHISKQGVSQPSHYSQWQCAPRELRMETGSCHPAVTCCTPPTPPHERAQDNCAPQRNDFSEPRLLPFSHTKKTAKLLNLRL